MQYPFVYKAGQCPDDLEGQAPPSLVRGKNPFDVLVMVPDGRTAVIPFRGFIRDGAWVRAWVMERFSKHFSGGMELWAPCSCCKHFRIIQEHEALDPFQDFTFMALPTSLGSVRTMKIQATDNVIPKPVQALERPQPASQRRPPGQCPQSTSRLPGRLNLKTHLQTISSSSWRRPRRQGAGQWRTPTPSPRPREALEEATPQGLPTQDQGPGKEGSQKGQPIVKAPPADVKPGGHKEAMDDSAEDSDKVTVIVEPETPGLQTLKGEGRNKRPRLGRSLWTHPRSRSWMSTSIPCLLPSRPPGFRKCRQWYRGFRSRRRRRSRSPAFRKGKSCSSCRRVARPSAGLVLTRRRP